MWYQLFRDSEETITWESLKDALHTHYGPTVFECHFGNLTKLQQVGTMRHYQLQFEQLLSRVGKLSISHQLGCFVSRFKGNLRMEVQALKPSMLTKAIGLARLYEAKIGSSKKNPILEDCRLGSKELLYQKENYKQQNAPKVSYNVTFLKKIFASTRIGMQ